MTTPQVTTVGDDYPVQQARCRELLTLYYALGEVGAFGAVQIEAALKQADEAAISGDIVAILKAYQAMKGCA